MNNHFGLNFHYFGGSLWIVFLLFSAVNLPAQTFNQESVSFQNNDVLLAGNLFLPVSKDKVPAVVILHGSGPDEGLEYKIYAEEFCKAGIATLVFDKRGSGKSGGDWRKRPFELMAGDALAAVKFLQNRSEISPDKIGLWGISQGGWTAAYATARSKEVAFVISVSGNAVSPAQQEVWHKDQIYQTLDYSEKSRDTARKFWQMVFNWLVLVDEGKFPCPEGVLESERSAGSIGLNYNPLPDWEKIAQPVLLIHGEYDKLSPANESISRISAALTKAGNLDFRVLIFPHSSHTMTTNKIGLEFDWEEHFAPNYFKSTTDWILCHTGQKSFCDKEFQGIKLEPSPDFDEAGRFGKVTWYGGAYPQIVLIIVFPSFFLIGLLVSIYSFLRNNSFLPLAAGLICLLNFLLTIGFYLFLANSVFPQGINLMTAYTIPFWQRILPFLGSLSLILTIILLIVFLLKDKK
jgi:hypothetical protein